MITVGNLDINVKSSVRDIMRTQLLKKYRTLPLPNQTDWVTEVLTPELKRELNNVIAKHYAMFSEHDVECNLTEQNFIDIYFNKA